MCLESNLANGIQKRRREGKGRGGEGKEEAGANRAKSDRLKQ